MLKQTNPRLLLAELRQGDYAHPGDTEAIDIVINDILKLMDKNSDNASVKVLDVGCGLAGTTDYFKMKTGFDVYGIDIDPGAIVHGQAKYPHLNLTECDIMNVATQFSPAYFDLIYLFNVFYTLHSQKESLACLSSVAKDGTILAIFDYVSENKDTVFPNDFAGNPMKPVIMSELKKWLFESNWKLLKFDDLSTKYLEWYENFLATLNAKKSALTEKYTQETIDQVEKTFAFIVDNLKQKNISGGVFYAKKAPRHRFY